MSAALRWFGLGVFGIISLASLAIAPASGGLSLLVGAPAICIVICLGRNDPADSPDISGAGVIALSLAVLAMLWVFLALWRDTDIYGRPL